MVMYGIWIPEDDRDVKPVGGTCEVVPLRPELLAAGGSVANPRARRIDPGRFRRRRQGGAAALRLMMVLALCAAAWGLVYMAVACLWRWAEPLAAIIGIGAAIAATIVGIGLPG